MKTKEKIITKALELFNKRGIEYVGMRELAASLDMRVSNITYYFPTKDDLVNQLALALNKLNAGLLVENDSITMQLFLEVLRKVFDNQLKYRCLLLSIVHLMQHNKEIAKRHKRTQKDRNAILKSNLIALTRQGYLEIDDESEAEYLASAISIIARFWISEATISFRQLSTEKQKTHYLFLIAQLLSPYATEKAKKQIRTFFEK